MLLKVISNIESTAAKHTQINGTVTEWKIEFGNQMPDIKVTDLHADPDETDEHDSEDN